MFELSSSLLSISELLPTSSLLLHSAFETSPRPMPFLCSLVALICDEDTEVKRLTMQENRQKILLYLVSAYPFRIPAALPEGAFDHPCDLCVRHVDCHLRCIYLLFSCFVGRRCLCNGVIGFFATFHRIYLLCFCLFAVGVVEMCMYYVLLA